jgi:8-oxo-dGTP pyrophosphatase MutT (NUDIX family)/phosphohistidine phosphatase SixA
VAEIFAAGAVLWRSSGAEIAVVHRPRYDDWSLPKGKLERGETRWAAAAREVAEETGFSCALGRYLGRISYPVSHPFPATKTVDYLAARAGSGQFQPNREVDELRWLPPAEAVNLLSYPHDHAVVREFLALPADPTQVLLVRHATAGDRKRWPGPDELRPLTAKGWRQAKAIHGLLPLFGVDRVHSAPPLRCVQTVQAVADELDMQLIEEPLLSERGYEPKAVDRLRDIAAPGTTPAICSQGGVIPDLLSRLGATAEPESAKGSVWLLSFTHNRELVAAHYIPKP